MKRLKYWLLFFVFVLTMPVAIFIVLLLHVLEKVDIYAGNEFFNYEL